MLSAGIEIKEIDLSFTIPTVSNAIACFAGEFTKGPSDKYVLITNTLELEKVFGKPTITTLNDWYQAYSFLQYGNKLYISRAVDKNGTFKDSGNEVLVVNELGKVEVKNQPKYIQVGSIVRFGEDVNEFKVKDIEDPVNAVKQVDVIVVNSAADGDYSVIVNKGLDTEQTITYTADVTNNGDTVETIAQNLGALLENVDTSATNISVEGAEITITASVAGIAMHNEISAGDMTLTNIQENVEAESWELVFEDVNGQPYDFSTIAVQGAKILVKYQAQNALVTCPIEGAKAKTAAELKPEALFIANETDYEVKESSIPVTGNSRIKFIAKSSGNSMNGVTIAVAREADFDKGTQTAFPGIALNSLFDKKPLEANKEIAVIIKDGAEIKETYIVSLKPNAKDYKNKSIYIENVLNKYSEYVYAKVNDAKTEMPSSRLYTAPVLDLAGNVITPAKNELLYLSNGDDGYVNGGDIAEAYGSVANNTIFGDENLDVDIVISNERARIAAGKLATERADCIAFHGPRMEDVVGLSSTKIVENLINDVQTGEMNNGATSNSYNAYFGNYLQIYDKFFDRTIWISPAGAVAGLRAQTNTNRASWWASAGIERGQIKGVLKIFFNPNKGQRDILYKNNINPIISLPGQGNAVVWGQKTLQKAASSFDRINVRGLFNTLERAISRFSKNLLFEFNDEITRNRFIGIVKPYLESVKAARGIYDFYIQCDESNNTPDVVDANKFVATIAIQPTKVAEFITLNFVATPTGVDFKEIFR